ncbi:MAG: hypothetical protein AAFX99_08865 [Myxococcota bacterium]
MNHHCFNPQSTRGRGTHTCVEGIGALVHVASSLATSVGYGVVCVWAALSGIACQVDTWSVSEEAEVVFAEGQAVRMLEVETSQINFSGTEAMVAGIQLEDPPTSNEQEAWTVRFGEEGPTELFQWSDAKPTIGQTIWRDRPSCEGQGDLCVFILTFARAEEDSDDLDELEAETLKVLVQIIGENAELPRGALVLRAVP